MEKENKKTKDATESEVRDVIAAFEQILEAVPNDRLALETLFDAYRQIGDLATALSYLVRLGQTAADDGDKESAPDLISKLSSIGGSSPEAQHTIARLEKLLERKHEPTAASRAAENKRKAVDITPELALAWNLTQAGELSQEDYSNVVHDLSENSSRNVEVPITVLHVLHDRAFKNIDKVMNFLSTDSGLPILNLASFEVQKDAYKALPIEVMMHRAALPFEAMGEDLLVALLNPYDTELQEDMRRITGRKCHFYLVTSETYDSCLASIRKAMEYATAKDNKDKAK